MYSFPRRPIDRSGFYRRRSWDAAIPRYDDVVCHFDMGQSCFADAGTGFAVPSAVGGDVAALRDLSVYGAHAQAIGTQSRTLVSDSGFSALRVETAVSTIAHMLTAASFMAAMQIVVYRSPTPYWWGEYGFLIGTTEAAAYTVYKGGYGNWYASPITVQRQNGVAQTPGAALASIDEINVVVLGHRSPSTIGQWMIGSSNQNRGFASYIYEALLFSSTLPTEDIQSIEAYLMDKYGIA